MTDVVTRRQVLSNAGFSQKQILIIDGIMQGTNTVVPAATATVVGGVLKSTTVATPAALTSSQNATAAAVDLPTAQTLANALKTSYNAAQVDVAALRTSLAAVIANLKTAGIMS